MTSLTRASLAVWFAIAFAFASTSAEAASCELGLRGRVLDRQLRLPLEGVVVGFGSSTTRSGPDGRFELKGLCEGEGELFARKEGFLSSHLRVRLPRSEPVELQLVFPMVSVVVRPPAGTDPLTSLGFSDTLDAEALVDRQGLGLAETLEASSGVTVLRSGAVAKPVIDGFYGNRILLLDDGLRHQGQLWALDHAPEIDPHGAGTMTVVRGADGVRYGADGIGGIIAIAPPAYPEEPSLRGRVSLFGASNAGRFGGHLGLLGAHPDLPRLGFRLQGSFEKSGAARTPGYALDNTGSETWNGTLGLRWRGDGWSASLSGSRFENHYGLFSGLRASPDEIAAAQAADAPLGKSLFRHSFDVERPRSAVAHQKARAELRFDLGPGELSTLYGYQHNDRREFEQARLVTSEAQLALTLETHSLELSYDFEIAPLRFLVGSSGLLQTNDHRGNRLIPDFRRVLGGVFALARWPLGDFDLAAGARYERQGMDTEQPARIAPNRNPPEKDHLSFDATMATVSLRYDPAELPLRAELHLASAARIPTIDELFLEGLVPNEPYYVEGDRSLRPERTVNIGLGAGLELAWLGVEAVGFYHHIDDYILRGTREDPTELLTRGEFPAQGYQAVDARQFGGSLDLDLHPWRGEGSWLGALALDARLSVVRGQARSDGSALPNIPVDRLTVALVFGPERLGPFTRTHFEVNGTFVARQTHWAPDLELVRPPPAYALLGATLSATLDVADQPLRIGLEGRNLTNHRYRDYLSRLRLSAAHEPGIDLLLRLTLPFGAPETKGTHDEV